MRYTNVYYAGISYYPFVNKGNIVGKRVTEARKQAKPKITQPDLVARLEVQGLKVDQTIVSKIEHGVRPVTDVELVALAGALGVTVNWLLGIKGKS